MSDPERSVVVGYDGSPAGELAVKWAAAEASRGDEPLIVLVATDYIRQMTDLVPLSGVGGRILKEEIDGSGLIAEAERRATEGATLARTAVPSVKAQPSVSLSGAVAALCEAAQGASLVVVGSSGHGRVMHGLLGSVAFAVVTHSEASVVAVRGDQIIEAGHGHPVVVGVDGSPGSDAAVDHAAEFASAHGSDLLVVSAWETPRVDQWGRIYLADNEWRRKDTVHARQNAELLVGRARTRAEEKHPDLSVHEVAREGRPEQVIAEAHDDAALVVVGARGHGDYVSLLLGSVGRGVVHRAHCPVAIIR